MPTPLTDADKVLRNDTGIDIATNIASIASALTPSNITDLGDVNLTNPITDGQVIKYDTATQKWVNGLGNITMECTQAQYDAWKQSGQLKTNTLYVITDAPNLNATAQEISYDGGAVTVKDKIDVSDVSSAITLNANFTDTSKYLYKSANVCSLEIRGKLTATSATTIATFNNSTYYPKCSRVVTAYLDTDNPSATPNGAVWLYDNGNIVYFGNSVSSKNVIISVTYICKG